MRSIKAQHGEDIGCIELGGHVLNVHLAKRLQLAHLKVATIDMGAGEASPDLALTKIVP